MAKLSIDFGASYCAATWLPPAANKPEAIAFGTDEYNNGKRCKFPSAIVYVNDKDGNENKIVGEEAYSLIMSNNITAANYCYKIKTEMRPNVFREINNKRRSYDDIIGDVFIAIKERAAQMTNQPVDRFDEVTIMHPVEFAYVDLLKSAAQKAGWEESKITFMDEPVAAIYGFNVNQTIPDNSGLIVFDYGGGTIDVAYMLKKSNTDFRQFFPPKSESRCGGEYIDIALHNYFRTQAGTTDDDMIDFDLLNQCRRLKIGFSDIRINARKVVYKGVAYRLSRNKFTEIISQKVDRAIKVFKYIVDECKSKECRIDYILLNGGSSKLHLVREQIKSAGFTDEQLISFEEEEDIAVAVGGMYRNGHSPDSIPEDASALYSVGYRYENGYGVTQNYVEAVKWYRKSAEQGYALAQCSLGWMYQNGYGVTQDYAEAVKWYRKSVVQRNALAQYSLGFMYQNGYGVTKNYAIAIEWYRKSAEQGNASAQCSLGWMYQNGYGVTQDYVESVKWYRKSAEQGNYSAKNALDKLDRLGKW